MKNKYRLDLMIRISQCDEHGHPYGGSALEVREDATLTASGFMGVAKVLARFDDLLNATKGQEVEG